MSQDPSTTAQGGAAVAEPLHVPALRLVSAADEAAPKPYDDVLVRDNFDDAGTIPTLGGVCQSPDIIPYGTGTLDLTKATSTYGGPDIGQNVLVMPGTNNIYIRGRNLRSGTETATVALYYADPSLFLLPQQWKKNQVTAADSTANVNLVGPSGTTLNAGDICLTQEAFYLKNLPGRHHCFIAVVKTPNTTVTIPDKFASSSHFVQWVQNNPAVAWRNIDVEPNTVTQILKTYQFGNPENVSNQFFFNIVGRNVPQGTTVSVQCTDSNCTFSQTLTMPAPYKGNISVTGFDQTVPANFQSAITVTATPPAGQKFPAKSSLSVNYLLIPPYDITPLHAEVSRFVAVARQAADGTTPAPTSQSMIPVGECTVEIRGPEQA
jgi:hypothetical protein